MTIYNKQTAYNLLIELSNEIIAGNLPYDVHIAEVCDLAKQAGATPNKIRNIRERLLSDSSQQT